MQKQYFIQMPEQVQKMLSASLIISTKYHILNPANLAFCSLVFVGLTSLTDVSSSSLPSLSLSFFLS